MNKKIASEIVIGIVLLLAIVIGGIFYWQNKISKVDSNQLGQKACSMEAKLCDDGSSVGRTGPNCEFAPCPTSSNQQVTQMANPASVYCEQNGGKSEIITAADGSQTGYCKFNDGAECEEWAYFRKECEQEQNVQAGYKIVRVNNPDVKFYFEVPEKWLTETRNSGEKQMTIDDKKVFLIDVFDANNIYADYTKKDFMKMNSNEIEDFFKKYNIPIASVAKTVLQYTDWSPQIDFYVGNFVINNEINTLKKNACDNNACPICKTAIGKIGKKNNVPIINCSEEKKSECAIGEQKIAGFDSNFIRFDTSIEDGKKVADKACTGGTYYFIPIGDGKVLKINKQLLGDEQFEKDFEHIIQTFKFIK